MANTKVNILAWVLAGFFLLSFSSLADAAPVYVEPDAYVDGAILNNAHVGVTLSALGGYFGADNNVYSRFSSLASTGTQVFGNSWDSEGAGDFTTRWGFADFFQSHLKVEFDSPVSSVSIDAIGNDPLGAESVDLGLLKAYNAADELIATYETAELATGIAETMTITRPTAEIAYILAAGTGVNFIEIGSNLIPTYATIDLDNMVYDGMMLDIELQGIVIPLPPAVWLGFALLASGIFWQLRRRA